jgi:signal transduction histidine kinase
MVHAVPFAVEGARAVGAELVDAHFTSAQALSRTIVVLSSAPGSAGVGEDEQPRWARLLGAVAESFTASLVDRIRREQQEILEAAFTARDQAERALRSTERRLERAREDFITTVSHELKTPLTPIKGYLHMLRSRDESMTAEQRQRCYAVMIDQAELLAGLVQDLLGAAELQHVGFSVRMRPAEVREVIEKALESVPLESQHRFVFRCDGALGLAQCGPGPASAGDHQPAVQRGAILARRPARARDGVPGGGGGAHRGAGLRPGCSAGARRGRLRPVPTDRKQS